MKLLNFKVADELRLGIKTAQGIIDASQIATLDDVIANEEILGELEQFAAENPAVIPEDKVTYAPCVTQPEKILCVGLNYLSHREETDMVAVPDFPVLFSKFNNALASHKQVIKLPSTAEKIDYEAELVIVIGKEAKNIAPEEALAYVFGYTIGNDLSARDLQLRTSQWLIGKTLDHFAPIGPYLVTADEIDPQNLAITCTVNGEIRQSASTNAMIFDCATIVSYLSHLMTLKPGDIIFTGTPSGVILGYPEDKQIWLQAGDQVEVTIEKLGSLSNRFE